MTPNNKVHVLWSSWLGVRHSPGAMTSFQHERTLGVRPAKGKGKFTPLPLFHLDSRLVLGDATGGTAYNIISLLPFWEEFLELHSEKFNQASLCATGKVLPSASRIF